jgi:hypothetical protein
MLGKNIDADVALKADSLHFVYADSTEINVKSGNFDLAAVASMDTLEVGAKVKLKTPNLFFALNNEPYILDKELTLNTDVAYGLLTGNVGILSLIAQIATLSLNTNGLIVNDTTNGYNIQLDYEVATRF